SCHLNFAADRCRSPSKWRAFYASNKITQPFFLTFWPFAQVLYKNSLKAPKNRFLLGTFCLSHRLAIPK
ncbi:hypothetical protein, partial [Neptunicella marina]|uniref:hypothetical protein n=1 Tax=Neptunicella marina TaxID=2125989 RepID=UPI0019D51465